MFRTAVVTSLLLASGAAASGSGRPAATPDWPRVHLELPDGGQFVRFALNGATLRLAHPRCRRLFSEFQDEHGRPLRARLDELRQDETSYLPLIVFADGTETAQCREGAVLAYTEPGSRVVFVCGRRFERAWRKSRWKVEAVIIHEALHTLGLGENPPASVEITRRVQFYCTN